MTFKNDKPHLVLSRWSVSFIFWGDWNVFGFAAGVGFAVAAMP